MGVEMVVPAALKAPAETVFWTVECLLHKYYCNWQQVTLLNRKGLQEAFVSCFRFAPQKRPCPTPARLKMFPVLPCFRLIFDEAEIKGIFCNGTGQ